jgi:hypothetical protein
VFRARRFEPTLERLPVNGFQDTSTPSASRVINSCTPDISDIDVKHSKSPLGLPLDKIPPELSQGLIEVVGKWPTLSAVIRVGIVAMVKRLAVALFVMPGSLGWQSTDRRKSLPRRQSWRIARLSRDRHPAAHEACLCILDPHGQPAVAAAFIVLEFRGPTCKRENLERNSRDFESFVRALDSHAPIPDIGQLSGPFKVPGGEFVPAGLPLFIGKAVRRVC